MEFSKDDFKKLMLAALYFATEADLYYDEYGKQNAMLETNAKNIVDFLVRVVGDNGEKYTPTATPFIHYYIYEIRINDKLDTFTYDAQYISIKNVDMLWEVCNDWV